MRSYVVIDNRADVVVRAEPESVGLVAIGSHSLRLSKMIERGHEASPHNIVIFSAVEAVELDLKCCVAHCGRLRGQDICEAKAVAIEEELPLSISQRNLVALKDVLGRVEDVDIVRAKVLNETD